MFAIIVGYSPVSHLLAESLISSGHEICILEKNYEKTEYLWDKFGSMIIHGDATHKEYLEKAGVNRPADILFALTGDDGVNLLICQAAQEIYNVRQTVSLLNDINLKSLFNVSGISNVIERDHFLLQELEHLISDSSLKHILSIQEGSTNLLSVNVPSDSKIVMDNIPISGLDLPERCIICLIIRDGVPLRPSNNLILAADDQVILSGSANDETRIYNILTGV